MIERIEISSGSELVATHPRDWGAEHTAYDPRRYLALLECKPVASQGVVYEFGFGLSRRCCGA